jgi:hypothetical protein
LIKFISNNNLLVDTLNNYYLEHSFVLVNNHYFQKIKLENDEKNIILEFEKKKILIPLPIQISVLKNEINKVLSNFEIQLRDFNYYPFQNFIQTKSKKVFLTNIQNLIFSNLINAKQGLDKNVLYETIWKQDKDISINKLDTHLTNLKNLLNSSLNIHITFQSKNKKIELLID